MRVVICLGLMSAWGCGSSPAVTPVPQSSSAPSADEVSGDVFKPPVRLTVEGKVIDSGEAGGHSAPSCEDLDGDGLKDLIVGDYSGTFRWYKNVGTAKQPVFQDAGKIQASTSNAQVRIYCCIGSQARFCDLNGDGIRDMLSNSYDPGHAYLFPGLANRQFAAREEILDNSGTPVRSNPVQKQSHQSFGSFFEPVDWDADGDIDILIGCFSGELKVRLNEGTSLNPSFATENISVQIDGKPLTVEGHLCPRVADWDGDGQWDIIAGSADGSVTWFRNIGTATSPAFASGELLVQKHNGSGYDRQLWNKSQTSPGIRSQVEVVDYDDDGKLDLLVGDFYSAYDFKSGLSDRQKQEVVELIAGITTVSQRFKDKLDALRKDFSSRYPGDQIYNDAANREWGTAYQQLQNGPEAKGLAKAEKQFTTKMRPYLASTRDKGDRSFDLAKPHGHVWVFIRN